MAMKKIRSNKLKSRKMDLSISRKMYDFDLLPKVSTIDQRGCKDPDRISELPDDILSYILSFLTLREATVTKILSTRWRHLYTKSNTILLKYPFPTKHEKGDLHGCYQIGDETLLSDHMKWVNHTLDSYTGGRVIKKFRVDIPYTTEANNSAINEKLLKFALSRDTEIIDINAVYPELNQLLDFSAREIITNGPRSSLPGLKCLKELSLSGVSMSREITILIWELVALERLLLESLEVKKTYADRDLKPLYYCYDLVIDGRPTSKLKHLIISNVSSHRHRVSNLMNLVSLRCSGMVEYSIIDLYNLAKLVDLRVHGQINHLLVGECPSIKFDKCGELRRLELSTGIYKYNIMGARTMVTIGYCKFEFVRDRVKHLQINVVVDEGCNLHQLFSLIEGFPCLEQLEIKFIWSFKPKYYKHRRLDEERANRVTTFDYLHTIKVSEFCGSVAELEFVLCVINNGVVLGKVIVEGFATNSAIQQKEIAHSFKHLISVAPSFVDLILK